MRNELCRKNRLHRPHRSLSVFRRYNPSPDEGVTNGAKPEFVHREIQRPDDQLDPQHLGRDVRYQLIAALEQRLIEWSIALTGMPGLFSIRPSLANQFKWNNSSVVGGWDAELERLRAINPILMSVPDWIETIDFQEGVLLC